MQKSSSLKMNSFGINPAQQRVDRIRQFINNKGIGRGIPDKFVNIFQKRGESYERMILSRRTKSDQPDTGIT